MMESAKTKAPKGLLILGILQIFVPLRNLWNLFYHQNLRWEFDIIFYLLVALLCGVVGIGLVKMKTWAYRTFIAIYVIYILGYVGHVVGGQAPLGFTLTEYRFKNLKAAIVCSALLAWLFYYRRVFVKRKNDQAVPPDRQETVPVSR